MKKYLNDLKNRVVTNFKENKVLLLVFSIIWILTVTLTLVHYGPSLGYESYGNDIQDYVIELDEDTTLIQTVPVTQTSKSVAVKFATYARNNKGQVNIKVVGNDNNDTYFDESYATSSFNDNAFKTFKLNKELDAKDNKSITISLKSNSKLGEGVGVYYSNDHFFENSNLDINSENQTGDLTMKYLYESELLHTFYTRTITWTVVGFSLIILLILLVKPKYEVLFPLIILIFGLVLMAVIVPLSTPDEQYHYEAVLQVTNKILNPKSDYAFVNKRYVDYSYLYGHYNVSGGYLRLMNELNIPMKLSDKLIEVKSPIDESTYILCYAPHILAVLISRILNFNMLRTFYTGRLFSLLAYCAIVYIVIKNTPIHKFLFGVVCSFPMFVQTAISYTYDTYLICLCMLVASFFLKWRYVEKKISIKEYIFVLICCLGLAPLKFVYGFVSLVFLFTPNERFKDTKTKWLAVIALMVAGMWVIVPTIGQRLVKYFDDFIDSFKTVSIKADETVNGSNVVDVSGVIAEEEIKDFENIYSTSYVFKHPFETAEIFIRTIRYNIKTWFYASIGRTMSGATLTLPLYLVHGLVIIAIASAFRAEPLSPSLGMRFVLPGMCALVGVVIMAGFFVTWTSKDQTIIEAYGGPIVQGIQGRYFCPILPYFLTVFNNKKIKLSEKFDKYLIFAMLIIMFEIIVYILSYTFVNSLGGL